MKNGVCRLCNQETQLSYEHIPPKCAFNKNTKHTVGSFFEFMKSKQPLEHKVKGKFMQGGIGFHAYCQECNTFLGNEYVRIYKKWAQTGAIALSNGNFEAYEYTALKQYPNRILKQIVSMFIGIHDTRFGQQYPELIEFVKNPDSTELNSRFRILTYLNTKGMYRYSEFMVTYMNGNIIKCSEITFPPFGYVLLIDNNLEYQHLLDITTFKNVAPNVEMNIDLKIRKLETHRPLPLDYRSLDDIKHGMED
jgi:hypothetical protein